MRRSNGTHNLLRLRLFLALKQSTFAAELGLSGSLVQKLEHGIKPLGRPLAEDIAARTGISADWLLANNPTEPLVDGRGRPFSEDRYKRMQFAGRNLIPALKAPIAVRAALLENYGKARDLFLRPEMYQHFVRYIIDLERLRMRYEEEALFASEEPTAGELIDEDARQRNPDTLYPSVMRDVAKCQRAITRERKRIERLKAKEEQSLGPLEPRSLTLAKKKIRAALTGR